MVMMSDGIYNAQPLKQPHGGLFIALMYILPQSNKKDRHRLSVTVSRSSDVPL